MTHVVKKMKIPVKHAARLNGLYAPTPRIRRHTAVDFSESVTLIVFGNRANMVIVAIFLALNPVAISVSLREHESTVIKKDALNFLCSTVY
jgi:hypothetical protein